jgi:hypothetical protein
VPVLLDNPRPEGSTGMTEAVLAISYDPSVLSVASSDITLGSIPGLGTEWRMESVVDQAAGRIAITLYSTTAITEAQAGSLVYIGFHLVPRSSASVTAIQLLPSVTVNGQQYVTQVDDAQGQLLLGPGTDRLVLNSASWRSRSAPSGGWGVSACRRPRFPQ